MKKQVLLIERNGEQKIFAVGNSMKLLLDGIEKEFERINILPTSPYRVDERHLVLSNGAGDYRYSIIELDTLTDEWENGALTDSECLEEILEEINFKENNND